jgi:hypothetical protein
MSRSRSEKAAKGCKKAASTNGGSLAALSRPRAILVPFSQIPPRPKEGEGCQAATICARQPLAALADLEGKADASG